MEQEKLVWIYSAFFFSAILFSLLLNAIFLRFSKTLGMRDHENTVIRWNSVSKPSLGGISFYIIFLMSLVGYSIFFNSGDVFKNPQAIGIISAAGLAFIMGLADDAYNTKPFLKFLVQIICAIILIVNGVYIRFFEGDILNYILTVFWVVGIMNSINMLDNMDAITTSVSCFIIGSALIYMGIQHSSTSFDFILLLGVLASLIGFLFYNWYPSKIFMGDTGSQFLGVFLAYIGINYLWNSKGIDTSIDNSRQIITVLIAFLLPLVDTIVVVVNRIRRKQSPFVGGKDHTTHNLSYLGLSDAKVAIIFIGLSLVSMTFLILIFTYINTWTVIHTLLFFAYFLAVLSAFFIITRINAKKIKK